MTSLKSILTFIGLFFFINCSRNVSAKMTENTCMHSSPDLKNAIQKIDELQKIMLAQEKRISILERRPEESEVRTGMEFRKILKEQNDRIAQLEERIQELESAIKVEKYAPIETYEYKPYSDAERNSIQSNKNIYRKERLLSIQPTTVPVDKVAFYAYLSSSVPASDAHRIIPFDTVITNVGNAYHPHMGTLIAPKSGLYVFSWTIRLSGQRYHTTELVVNNKIVNALHFNPNGQIDGSVSSSVVVHVDQGDDVLIRTNANYHNGEVISNYDGRSSFAGWILI